MNRIRTRLGHLGHRTRLVGSGFVLLVLALAGLGIWWDLTPGFLSNPPTDKPVGYATVDMLIRVGDTLLHKPGGYLRNDRLPPGVLLDNMPSWELGVLNQMRDLAQALRNDFGRAQSQSQEDKDLAAAQSLLNQPDNRWWWPSTEGQYNKGLQALERFRIRLVDVNYQDAQFYARADNLAAYLWLVERRLGDLTSRLSASVARVSLDLSLVGAKGGAVSTPRQAQRIMKTPSSQVDDVFFEARGSAWALYHFLQAVQVDCRDVLKDKNAEVGLAQIVRDLEESQRSLGSPWVLNGTGFGVLANHSLTLASYLARANAGVINLRELLSQG